MSSLRLFPTLRLAAALALCSACGGGGSNSGTPTTPVDHPPAWSSFSWVYRGGYGVLSAAASDPDGTATAITCTGALAKSYTNTALDSLALPPASTAQTINESCDATSNGKSAGAQNGSFVIPRFTGLVVVASATATPTAPLVGDTVSLAITARADSGALGPDSIVVATGSPRVAVGSTYTGRVVAILGAVSVPITVWGRNSAGIAISSTGSVSYTTAAAVTITWSLKELLGDTVLHSAATLVVNGASVAFVNGVATTRIAKGQTLTYGLVNNAATMNGDYLTFSDGRMHRANFPRFRYSATSPYATDTLTATADLGITVARVTRSDVSWNDLTFAVWLGTFDELTAGNLAFTTGALHVYIATKNLSPAVQANGCVDMTDAKIQQAAMQWAAETQVRFPEYAITIDSGPTPPMYTGVTSTGVPFTFPAARTFVLCQFVDQLSNTLYSSKDYGDTQNKTLVSAVARVKPNPANAQAAANWEIWAWRGEATSPLDGRGSPDPTLTTLYQPGYGANLNANPNWTPWDNQRRRIQSRLSRAAADRRAASITFVTPYFSYRTP